MGLSRLVSCRRCLLVSLCLIFFLSCDDRRSPTVSIAVNAWPGYSFLYLAEQKGLFQRHGLSVKLVPVDSLLDGQRAYMHERVDGLASTIVETVYAHYESSRPLSVILISSYSNGGDVIVAKKGITSIGALKGKRVGCEIGSLGVYMLQRALAQAHLQLSDVEVVHVEQSAAAGAFADDSIDAYVTYPPVSFELLETPSLRKLFTSADIPFEIIDTIAVDQKVLAASPMFVDAFRAAWQESIEYFRSHPVESSQFLAEKLGMSQADLNGTINDMVVLDITAQASNLKGAQKLDLRVQQVCATLRYTGALESECDKAGELFNLYVNREE